MSLQGFNLEYSHISMGQEVPAPGGTCESGIFPVFYGIQRKPGSMDPKFLIPEFPSVPGPGAPELLGSFFPAGIPRVLDLHLLFAPIPLGNFHPFPVPVFLGILFIWNVPMEQLLWDFGSSLFGIGLGKMIPWDLHKIWEGIPRDPPAQPQPRGLAGKIQMKAKFQRN